MHFAALALLMIFMAVAVVQVIGVGIYASDQQDTPNELRSVVLVSNIWFITSGLGLFVLAAMRFAELLFQ